jgi:hypothetical protein
MSAPLLSRFLLVLLTGLTLSGCASFERDWRAAATSAPGRDPFAGRWEGRWTSAKHRTASGFAGGRLRCLLTPLDERRYEGRFKADWLIFASGYTTRFDVERRGGTLRLAGEHRMSPIFGGTYRYQGRVTPTRFTATYDSSYDHGTLEMTRP